MQPLATMSIHARANVGDSPEHHVYEGEAVMSQPQKDRYKALIGDGLSKVTVGSDFGEKDFGNGGGVFVNVTLTCDQSEPVVQQAISLAHEIATSYAWHYRNQLRQQLINAGILRP